MVKFLPKYALTVLMLAVVCLSARATIDRSAKIDSLKIVLQTVNTPGDSVKILYDILDLSTPYRNPQEAAKLLYAAAVNAGDTAVQINAIRYQANIMSGHPDYLEHLHAELKRNQTAHRAVSAREQDEERYNRRLRQRNIAPHSSLYQNASREPVRKSEVPLSGVRPPLAFYAGFAP